MKKMDILEPNQDLSDMKEAAGRLSELEISVAKILREILEHLGFFWPALVFCPASLAFYMLFFSLCGRLFQLVSFSLLCYFKNSFLTVLCYVRVLRPR